MSILNQNNLMAGQPQFNPYTLPSWKLPTYSAAPIHGKDAAWQFPMGPNSEIYLPDDAEDIIWWIRTDQNGNKTVKPFDVSPHEEPKPIDINDILARLGALEEQVNGKSNKSTTKRTTTESIG